MNFGEPVRVETAEKYGSGWLYRLSTGNLCQRTKETAPMIDEYWKARKQKKQVEIFCEQQQKNEEARKKDGLFIFKEREKPLFPEPPPSQKKMGEYKFASISWDRINLDEILSIRPPSVDRKRECSNQDRRKRLKRVQKLKLTQRPCKYFVQMPKKNTLDS